jgi:hypothetical protein
VAAFTAIGGERALAMALHPFTVATKKHFDWVNRQLKRLERRPVNAASFDSYWERPREKFGRYYGAPGGFAVLLSPPLFDRALVLLDGLAKDLAERGFRLEFLKDDPNRRRQERVSNVAAIKSRESVAFYLREGYRRYELTGKEWAAAIKERSYASKYEFQPSGKLTLVFDGDEWGDGCSGEFADGKTTLEEQLPRIVEAMDAAVPAQAARRKQRLGEEQRQHEAEGRRRQRQEAARKERETVKAIVDEASRALQIAQARTYLNALQESCTGPLPEQSLRWLERMRTALNARDPAVMRRMRILSGRRLDADLTDAAWGSDDEDEDY